MSGFQKKSGSGTVTTITSSTLTVTNPNGPIVDIETAASVTSVTGDATVIASPTTGAVLLTRGALTGDITAAQGSNVTTLKNTGPGATGPIGSATTVPVVTIDAQGRVTALSSATIAVPLNISKSFIVPGAVANSATTPIPWDYAPPLATGQTATLIEAIYSLASGTCTLAVQQQAFGAPSSFANVSGLGALAVSSTPAHTSATVPPTVNSRDMFQIVITAGSSPVGLTVTLVYAINQT